MALRTVSPSARASLISSVIGQSERERLQKAVDAIESSFSSYKSKADRRKKQSGYYNVAKFAGDRLLDFAATGASQAFTPIVSTIGATLKSIGSLGKERLAAATKRDAQSISTSALDPLSQLLFVGEQAKNVSIGADQIKEKAKLDASNQLTKARIGIAKDVGSTGIQLGQAGSFGSNVQDFLNKPLGDFIPEVEEDSSVAEAISIMQAKADQQSVGSLLGGVTPYQRSSFQRLFSGSDDVPNLKKDIQGEVTRNVTGSASVDPSFSAIKKPISNLSQSVQSVAIEEYDPKTDNEELILRLVRSAYGGTSENIKNLKDIQRMTNISSPSGDFSEGRPFQFKNVSEIFNIAFANQYGKTWNQLTKADKSKIFNDLRGFSSK